MAHQVKLAGGREERRPKFETDEAVSDRERERGDEFPRQNGMQKKVPIAIRLPLTNWLDETGRDGWTI